MKRYCERTGRDGIPRRDWSYYMVFNLFRLTGILQGVMQARCKATHRVRAIATGKRTSPWQAQPRPMVEQLAWPSMRRAVASRRPLTPPTSYRRPLMDFSTPPKSSTCNSA